MFAGQCEVNDRIAGRVAKACSSVGAQVTHEFVSISWNACGMEQGVIDCADLLDAGPSWDVLMLQEGPYSESYHTQSGH